MNDVAIGESAILERIELVCIALGREVMTHRVADCRVVGLGCRCDIIVRLRAPLNLERIDCAALDEFLDVRREIQVFGVEDVRPHALFFDKLHHHARVGLAHEMRAVFCVKHCRRTWRLNQIGVVKATIVGATPAIGHAPVLQRADEAAPRKCEAHAAMHEDFNLEMWQRALDLAQVVQAHLARRDDALHAHVVVALRVQHVEHICLGREVKRNLWRDFLREAQHARRGDNQRVHADVSEPREMFLERVNLAIERESIDRGVEFLAHRVRVVDRLGEAFVGELFRRSAAQREMAHIAITRVSAIREGDFEFFEIASG